MTVRLSHGMVCAVLNISCTLMPYMLHLIFTDIIAVESCSFNCYFYKRGEILLAYLGQGYYLCPLIYEI